MRLYAITIFLEVSYYFSHNYFTYECGYNTCTDCASGPLEGDGLPPPAPRPHTRPPPFAVSEPDCRGGAVPGPVGRDPLPLQTPHKRN